MLLFGNVCWENLISYGHLFSSKKSPPPLNAIIHSFYWDINHGIISITNKIYFSISWRNFLLLQTFLSLFLYVIIIIFFFVVPSCFRLLFHSLLFFPLVEDKHTEIVVYLTKVLSPFHVTFSIVDSWRII